MIGMGKPAFGVHRMSEQEIENCIARIALSDRRSFDRLYELVSSKLFGVTMRILKDSNLAEDALQEIFVKIWQKADSYRPDGQSAMAWLVAIARNHSIDLIRVNGRPNEDIDDHVDLKSAVPTPEQAAVNSSERQRMDNCLAALEPQKAEAVVAAYVEGYSYQELADRYAIPLNTMRTWLRRSLISLRECLGNG
jgi:RNA polymerase sigma-70 factor (ECF subfamily)